MHFCLHKGPTTSSLWNASISPILFQELPSSQNKFIAMVQFTLPTFFFFPLFSGLSFNIYLLQYLCCFVLHYFICACLVNTIMQNVHRVANQLSSLWLKPVLGSTANSLFSSIQKHTKAYVICTLYPVQWMFYRSEEADYCKSINKSTKAW